MPAPNAISNDKLFRLIGTPRAPLLLDVRSDEDYEADPRLIPGAIRADDQALAAFAAAWYYTGGDLAALPQRLQSLGADSLPHAGAKLI